jgi:hypothetical protein
MRWEGDEKAFEKDPWSLMLITLGQTIEKDPWTPITNKCWHFDTEAIEDHGSYIDIIENINRISGPYLRFTNIKDFVDIEKKSAWVSFDLNDRDYKWDIKVDDDWVDMNLFKRIQNAIRLASAIGKFYWYDTGGQSFVMGYYTEEELKEIEKKTGLVFQEVSV